MPPRRSTRAASASQTPAVETKPTKPPRRSARAGSASQTPLVETKPVKRKRGQTFEPHNVELEEDDDVETKPKRGKRESDIQAPPAAQPPSKPHNGVAEAAHVVSDSERQPSTPAAAAEEEDLEEKSLFDPPPMPGPSNLPRAIPEEPAGPKSRLVIHKMVLINFKSYAGRQEIGPFHKVINIRQAPTIKVDLF